MRQSAVDEGMFVGEMKEALGRATLRRLCVEPISLPVLEGEKMWRSDSADHIPGHDHVQLIAYHFHLENSNEAQLEVSCMLAWPS